MIKSKLLSDFSNIAQGAFSTVNAIREELDVMVRSRIERVLTSKGLVTKEENDQYVQRARWTSKPWQISGQSWLVQNGGVGS